MILESLTLDNIRSYGHGEIMFERGTTLFEGDVGSGKSSLLMGIEFALFGSGRLELLLAKKAHTGKVTLAFVTGGKRYEVSRAIERKNGAVRQDSKDSYMMIDGEKHPLSAMDIKRQVFKILGFNEPVGSHTGSTIYRYAVFTPQGEMRSILGDHKNRHETIRRAFRIEDYKRAAANSTLLAGVIDRRADVLQERAKVSENLEVEARDSEAAAVGMAEEIISLENEITTAEAASAEAERETKELQERQAEKDRMQERISQAEKEAADHKKRAAAARQEITGAETGLAKSTAEIKRLEAVAPPTDKTGDSIQKEIEAIADTEGDLKVARGKHEECAGRIKRMGDIVGSSSDEEEKAAECRGQMDAAEQKRNDTKDKIGRLKTQRDEKKTLVDERRYEVKDLEGIDSRCPVCQRDVSKELKDKIKAEHGSKISALDAEIGELDDKIADAVEHTKKLKEEVDKAGKDAALHDKKSSRIKEYEAESANMSNIEAEIKTLEARHAELRTEYGCSTDDPIRELVTLKEGLAEYEKAGARIDGLREAARGHEGTISRLQEGIVEAEASSASCMDKAAGLSSQLGGFDGIDSEIEAAGKRRRDAEEKLNELNRELGSSRQGLEDKRQRVAECKKRIEEARKWGAEHAKFSEHSDWLTDFFKLTAEQIEKQVMLSILQGFNEAYRKWYMMLIDDPTKESSINEDFAPTVNQDGFEMDINGLSGGEKTSVALAYRLALNTMIRMEIKSLESNLLILDEPTDGFSMNQLAKIKDVFDELGSQQIILVSHEAELGAYVDRVFHISKENGKSKITAS